MANESDAPQLEDFFSDLRRRADDRLTLEEKAVGELTVDEARELIHELRVHQIELELQNEELREAQHELEIARDRFKSLSDFAPVGYITFNAEGRIVEGNLTAARMFGIPRPALKAGRLYRFVAEADRAVFFDHRRALFETGEQQTCEVRVVREDQSTFEALLESLPALGPDGKSAYRTVISDITARKKAEWGWRLADAIVDAANEGIVVLDPEWRIIRVNRAFTKMTGLSAEAVYGKDLEVVTASEYAGEVLDVLGARLRDEGEWEGEMWCRRRGGLAFPAWISFTAIRDERGNATHFAGLLVDITETKHAEEQMRHQAYHDVVTGLPNRSLFAERLSHAAKAAHRHGSMFGLLFLDLDRFKQVNDQLGHEAGDAALREVASRLAACVRENDTVARIGGDEFAVVLLDIEQAQSVATVADKILSALSEPIHVGDAEMVCGASIGIALYPGDSEDLDTLGRYADIAMYRAKDVGRNRYRFFAGGMTERALRHDRLERELGQALERDEFVLHYQPIVRVASSQVIGAEALLRWRHPQQGLLGPDRFLAVSEDTGQIHPLGDWVLRSACRDSIEWRGEEESGGPFVSINLSARQLHRAEDLDGIVERLRECGLPPERMTIEVTERGTIDSEHAGLERLMGLKQLGVRLAVDDFGTGQSALGYLRRFPFDIVKIDRSFVSEVERSLEAAHLVEAIIAMAHGPWPSHRSDWRGRRDAGAARLPARARVRLRAGVFHRPPGTGGGVSGAAEPGVGGLGLS